MKILLRAGLVLALSLVVNACGNDSDQGNTGGQGGVGGNAGGRAAGAGGSDAQAGKAGAVDSGHESSSAGAAGSGVLGEGGDSDGGEGGAANADAGALTPLVNAFCEAARSCCENPGALAQCEHSFSAQVDAVALLAAGSLEVNQSALRACVAAYQSAKGSCTLRDVRTACHGLFAGTVPDGGSCSNVIECDRSHASKICLRIGGAATGTCMAAERGSSGTACAQSCARGADCSTTTFAPDSSVPTALCHEEDGLYCPIGESCAPLLADGEACVWNEACGSDGFCVSTCDSRAQLGAPCQYNYGCAVGLACSAGKCAAEPFANDEACLGTPPALD